MISIEYCNEKSYSVTLQKRAPRVMDTIISVRNILVLHVTLSDAHNEAGEKV